MRIAVLVKQIPQPGELQLVRGALVRTGVPLETNAFCRRANAQAVALAGDGGEVVVFTMGPPSARRTLLEMIACGAHRGVLISDAALAGSDTLATSRVLAAAIEQEGPFDLILAGSHSLDAETGQVPPQVAEKLGLPFTGPCRSLVVEDGRVRASVEEGGGKLDVELALPAVLVAAERLINPSKASDEQIAAVAGQASIRDLTAADLGLSADRVGQAGSPTRVGEVVARPAAERARRVVDDVDEAVRLLVERVTRQAGAAATAAAPEPCGDGPSGAAGSGVLFVSDARGDAPDLGILSLAHHAAREANRPLTVYGAGLSESAAGAVAAYADRVMTVSGSTAPEDWAAFLADTVTRSPRPHAVLVEGTGWGREVASRLAARLDWGLVGDAVDVTTRDGRLVSWKSAFAGQAVVPIESTSPVLLCTLRPGSQAQLTAVTPAGGRPEVRTDRYELPAGSAVRYGALVSADADAGEMRRAKRLIVVGAGVDPASYPALEPLREVLDAGPLGATRKVTDAGWLPRSRQLGITGTSVQPDVVVSIGASGKFNHSAGFQAAGVVLAINPDPEAPVFGIADIAIVGTWEHVVPRLVGALQTSAEWKAAIGG